MPRSLVVAYSLGIRCVWLSYCLTLFVLTHMPIPREAAVLVSRWDKMMHCGAYLGLGLLTGLVFARLHPPRLPIRPLVAGLILYAALDEVLQGFVGRTPDVRDWLFDVVGVVMGLLLVQLGLKLWGVRLVEEFRRRSTAPAQVVASSSALFPTQLR